MKLSGTKKRYRLTDESRERSRSMRTLLLVRKLVSPNSRSAHAAWTAANTILFSGVFREVSDQNRATFPPIGKWSLDCVTRYLAATRCWGQPLSINGEIACGVNRWCCIGKTKEQYSQLRKSTRARSTSERDGDPPYGKR